MNTGLALALAVGLLLIAWIIIEPQLAARRRRALMRRGLSRDQRRILREQLPAYTRLPPALRGRLDALTAAFLGEKQFIGCQGLTVTPAMRLLIAAQACLLVMGREGPAYRALHSVLVYPAPFLVREQWQDDDGVVTEEARELAGQAWDVARIVLSWEDVRSARAGEQPYNVVIHEFAHYLEHEAGGDGALPHGVLQREYDALRAAVARGERTLLDPYAAEDPGEFLAVASEVFIESPGPLREQHPALYRVLCSRYGLDPARWRALDWRHRPGETRT